MAAGAVRAALRVYTRDRNREPPGGQLRREGEAEKQAGRVVQQARGSTAERRGCNKEKEERGGGGMRARKGGLERQEPREGSGGADKEREKPTADSRGPRAQTRAPPRAHGVSPAPRGGH